MSNPAWFTIPNMPLATSEPTATATATAFPPSSMDTSHEGVMANRGRRALAQAVDKKSSPSHETRSEVEEYVTQVIRFGTGQRVKTTVLSNQEQPPAMVEHSDAMLVSSPPAHALVARSTPLSPPRSHLAHIATHAAPGAIIPSSSPSLCGLAESPLGMGMPPLPLSLAPSQQHMMTSQQHQAPDYHSPGSVALRPAGGGRNVAAHDVLDFRPHLPAPLLASPSPLPAPPLARRTADAAPSPPARPVLPPSFRAAAIPLAEDPMAKWYQKHYGTMPMRININNNNMRNEEANEAGGGGRMIISTTKRENNHNHGMGDDDAAILLHHQEEHHDLLLLNHDATRLSSPPPPPPEHSALGAIVAMAASMGPRRSRSQSGGDGGRSTPHMSLPLLVTQSSIPAPPASGPILSAITAAALHQPPPSSSAPLPYSFMRNRSISAPGQRPANPLPALLHSNPVSPHRLSLPISFMDDLPPPPAAGLSVSHTVTAAVSEASLGSRSLSRSQHLSGGGSGGKRGSDASKGGRVGRMGAPFGAPLFGAPPPPPASTLLVEQVLMPPTWAGAKSNSSLDAAMEVDAVVLDADKVIPHLHQGIEDDTHAPPPPPPPTAIASVVRASATRSLSLLTPSHHPRSGNSGGTQQLSSKHGATTTSGGGGLGGQSGSGTAAGGGLGQTPSSLQPSMPPPLPSSLAWWKDPVAVFGEAVLLAPSSLAAANTMRGMHGAQSARRNLPLSSTHHPNHGHHRSGGWDRERGGRGSAYAPAASAPLHLPQTSDATEARLVFPLDRPLSLAGNGNGSGNGNGKQPVVPWMRAAMSQPAPQPAASGSTLGASLLVRRRRRVSERDGGVVSQVVMMEDEKMTRAEDVNDEVVMEDPVAKRACRMAMVEEEAMAINMPLEEDSEEEKKSGPTIMIPYIVPAMGMTAARQWGGGSGSGGGGGDAGMVTTSEERSGSDPMRQSGESSGQGSGGGEDKRTDTLLVPPTALPDACPVAPVAGPPAAPFDWRVNVDILHGSNRHGTDPSLIGFAAGAVLPPARVASPLLPVASTKAGGPVAPPHNPFSLLVPGGLKAASPFSHLASGNGSALDVRGALANAHVPIGLQGLLGGQSASHGAAKKTKTLPSHGEAVREQKGEGCGESVEMARREGMGVKRMAVEAGGSPPADSDGGSGS